MAGHPLRHRSTDARRTRTTQPSPPDPCPSPAPRSPARSRRRRPGRGRRLRHPARRPAARDRRRSRRPLRPDGTSEVTEFTAGGGYRVTRCGRDGRVVVSQTVSPILGPGRHDRASSRPSARSRASRSRMLYGDPADPRWAAEFRGAARGDRGAGDPADRPRRRPTRPRCRCRPAPADPASHSGRPAATMPAIGATGEGPRDDRPGRGSRRPDRRGRRRRRRLHELPVRPGGRARGRPATTTTTSTAAASTTTTRRSRRSSADTATGTRRTTAAA